MNESLRFLEFGIGNYGSDARVELSPATVDAEPETVIEDTIEVIENPITTMQPEVMADAQQVAARMTRTQSLGAHGMRHIRPFPATRNRREPMIVDPW